MVNDDFSDFVVVEIIPNGTTPVPIDSPSTFMGCILIAVTEAGSGLNNAGDITVRTVVGSRVDEFAAAGRGRSLSARIRIPTNYVASVQRLHGSVDASKVMELEGVQRANADTATPAELVVLDEGALQAGAGDIDLAGGVTMNAAGEDDAGLALAGATDIFFRAKANANNSAITIFVLMTFRKVV